MQRSNYMRRWKEHGSRMGEDISYNMTLSDFSYIREPEPK
jgi:hypothetical protein